MLLSTQCFSVALLMLAVVGASSSSAYPSYYGRHGGAYYPQQVRALYQPYRPAYNAAGYQQRYYQPSPYVGNKYAMRRSTEVLGGGAYNPGEEPFVLGEGEIGVGPSPAESLNPYADEAYYNHHQPQPDVPSFQGDPEFDQHQYPSEPQQFDDQQPGGAVASAQAIHQPGAETPTVKQQHVQQPAAHAPPHTYFPMTFGNTIGGAVAVANAFSTGKGSAASHAVAYGSAPNAAAARKHSL